MKVRYYWEDDNMASIAEITCSCEHVEKHEHSDWIVHDDEEWTCPICGKEHIFKWVGMILTEVRK